MKNFIPGRGVELDANFATHKGKCECCASGDLAQMCLEGSVLWKRENVVPQIGKRGERPEHFATRKELARVMRYK